MEPIRFVDNHDMFESLSTSLNKVLAFYGLSLNNRGQLIRVTAVSYLSEAEKRANTLKAS